MTELVSMAKKINKRPSSDEGSKFASRLNKAMKNGSLSVKEAASIAGVPPTTLSSWRAGSLPTAFSGLKRLCEHLGVSLEYMLTGEGDPSMTAVLPGFAEDGALIDCYAHIKIVRLIPRKKE